MRDLYAQDSMESLGGESLDQEMPFSVGKSVFTSFTGTTCLSLFFQMRTEGGAGCLLERIAVW